MGDLLVEFNRIVSLQFQPIGGEVAPQKLDFSAVQEVGDWAQETANWDRQQQTDPAQQEWGAASSSAAHW
ncbi:unnamed protein product [Anisakis simplex]|uniref:Uncharacterized protein n=1 Tax=Anisakis simplex TaxID=6269 RepID=A0A0M3JLW7_ANISI|nr:unnamed protein product [Anisakis simplex]